MDFIWFSLWKYAHTYSQGEWKYLAVQVKNLGSSFEHIVIEIGYLGKKIEVIFFGLKWVTSNLYSFNVELHPRRPEALLLFPAVSFTLNPLSVSKTTSLKLQLCFRPFLE